MHTQTVIFNGIFLCCLYFTNYFYRLCIEFKIFSLPLTLCCSKHLTGCLNTSQMRIGLRECSCSWLSEVSLCCLGENQEEEFNLSFYLDFRALQEDSERSGLVAWSSRFWGRNQNLVLYWEEKPTCHLQSQDLLFLRNGEPEEITGSVAGLRSFNLRKLRANATGSNWKLSREDTGREHLGSSAFFPLTSKYVIDGVQKILFQCSWKKQY